MSHHFDNSNWLFDAEVLADLKTYYVVSHNNAMVYDSYTSLYYTGTNMSNVFRTGHMWSYSNTFTKGKYHSYGLVHLLIEIQKKIGWEAFKEAFRELGSRDDIGMLSSLDKFNYFLTVLDNNTNQNVFNMINNADKNLIAEKFGGENAYGTQIKRYNPPSAAPAIANNSNFSTNISIKAGGHAIYRFIPKETGTYTIFTSRYGDSGAPSDTKIEVYNALQSYTVTSNSGTVETQG